MARNKRARYRNKRADYTKGGRVNYQYGGYGRGEGEDYMMNGRSEYTIPNIPKTPTPTVPTYTAADVEQAYADLNSGKVTAAQLASQYGVTEDYVNTNLAAHNAKVAAATPAATPPMMGGPGKGIASTAPVADPVGATKTIQPDADKGETFIPYNTSPYVSVDQTTTAPYSTEGDSDYEWGAAAQGITEGDATTLTDPDIGVTTADTTATVDPIANQTFTKAPPSVAAIPADGSYTQAETQAVVDAINSGTVTAAEVAAQFGVTEAQINAEMTRQNQVAAGEEVTVADPYAATATTDFDTGETTETPYVFRDMDAEKATADAAAAQAAADAKAAADAVAAAAAAQAKSAADVAAIPVDADYTQFEVDQVYDALESGAMTVQQVAAQFGATPAQVQAEWARMKQQKAGQAVTGEDPFAEGVYDATKDALQTKKVAEQQKARKDTVQDITFKGKPFNMGIPNLTSQILALDEQLKARGLKEGTPEYTAAQEQARAELVRFAQGTNQVNFSPEDFAAAVGRPVAEVLAGYYNYDFTGKDDLGLAYGKQVTEAMQDAHVPGSFLKDYKPIDTQAFVDERQAVELDVESGITADTAIQKLDAYVDIQPPMGISPAIMNKAVTNLKTAAETGEIGAKDYEAYLVNEINNNPQWAENLNRPPVTVDEIRKLTERAEAAEFGTIRPDAIAQVATKDFISDAASVGEVDFRKAVNVSPTKEAEAASREAITGTSQNSDAAKIIDDIGGYEAYKRSEVTGQAASDAAVAFVAETGNIESNLAKTMVQNPADFNAQVDNVEPEVVAAVAALPPEALVSSQMQTLMAGIETGEIPVWARPAYDTVNQNMAQRGIDASTVGRDALFNAIIQSALPIAQSNAQAIQANWSQRLSNQQQAELARAQLDSTRRMNNLANRQATESQTAQFAQNLNVLQSQFDQDRDTLSFQQQQQVRMTNLQNTQRTAELNKQAENAFKAQNLANEQQVELAELEIKNQTQQQNMTAENQERLVNMQMAADFLSKNAAFDQQMKLANLSNDQQMELANLTAMNQADSESLSADQQTRLANLNARMQTNLTQGRIAESMGVALLSADQQRAVENASMNARMDLTKFSAEQQIELANSRFMQTVELTDFNARQQAVMQNATALASLDMAAVDQRTKLEITQAQNFLQRDMANLSNEQQALILDTQVEQQRLLSSQAAENAARQFGATSDNQMTQFSESLAAQIEQFNSQQHNAMEQFNATEANRMTAMNQANAIDAAKFNNQLNTQIAQINEQYDLQRDQWNAANAQAVEQSNVQWRRQANTIDTAAVNAANQENAAKAFQISTAEQSFLWQSLRDDAAYLKQGYENEEQRKTTLYATALSNEIETGATGIQPIVDIVNSIIN